MLRPFRLIPEGKMMKRSQESGVRSQNKEVLFPLPLQGGARGLGLTDSQPKFTQTSFYLAVTGVQLS